MTSKKERDKERTKELTSALDRAEASLDPAITSPNEDGFDLAKANEERERVMAEIEEKIKAAVKAIKRSTPHQYSIKTKIELIERAKIMLDKYIGTVLVIDGTPRAYEVFANLVKSISDMAERVIKLEGNAAAKPEGEEEGEEGEPKKGKEPPAITTQDVMDALIKSRHSGPVDLSAVNVSTDEEEKQWGEGE